MPRAKQYQKSGRPKLDDNKVRKVRGFRASDEEWAEWGRKALANGFTNIYAWIRAVLDLVVVDPEPPVTPAEEGKADEAS